jgi:hypothetical protein
VRPPVMTIKKKPTCRIYIDAAVTEEAVSNSSILTFSLQGKSQHNYLSHLYKYRIRILFRECDVPHYKVKFSRYRPEQAPGDPES